MGFWNLRCISPLLSLRRTYQLTKAIPIRSVSTTDDSITRESSPSGDFDPKNAYHSPLVLLLNSGPQRDGVFIYFVHSPAFNYTGKLYLGLLEFVYFIGIEIFFV